MNRIKIWLDETMAKRVSVKWILIYCIIMLGSIYVIFDACIHPMHLLMTSNDWYLYDARYFLPIFIAGIIYSAYQLADEIRFLKRKED